MNNPNTLIVCESPFSGTNGYGVSLATFFGGWPPEKVAQYYRSKRLYDPDRRTDRMHHAPVPGNPVLDALPFLFGSRPEWAGHFSRKWVEKTLAGWRPQVIYSFFYSRGIARFADWLATTFKCPHILHVGDDGTSLTEGDQVELRRIYADARVRVAISHQMKLEYERRFGLPFEVLHNGAADELFENGTVEANTDGNFVVRYVGSLLRSQHWNAVEDIVEAVKQLAAEGLRIQFEIYCDPWTKKHALALEDGKYILHCGFAPKPKTYDLLRSADLLVLPATFSGANGSWYQLSMPTKLPEYLASGTPTLVYGPRGTASVELCLQHKLGLVLTKRSVSDLVQSIRNVHQDRHGHRRQAAEVRAFAKSHLSAAAAQKHFRGLVASALEPQAIAHVEP